MHNACFLEHFAFGNVTVLEIEALSRKLSMQYRAAKPLLPGAFHQEDENVSADAFAAPFAQYCHPANLHITVVRHHPATADGLASVQRERMKRMRVVGIHLDFFGHVLFFDKDGAPKRPRLFHLGLFSNLYYLDLRVHRFRRSGVRKSMKCCAESVRLV